MIKKMKIYFAPIVLLLLLSGCLGSLGPETGETERSRQSDNPSPPVSDDSIPDQVDSNMTDSSTPEATTDYRPRVVVGVPDDGFNPYHEIFYRPNLTQPPCEYLEGFPCNLKKLPLSVGGDDWKASVEADRDLLNNMERGVWYWIPQTVFVAVTCQEPDPGHETDGPCLTAYPTPHGAGTTSSILTENHDALLAIAAGGSWIHPFTEGGIPVDVHSVSFGNLVPRPIPNGAPDPVSDLCTYHETSPIYVTSAGNEPRSTLIDCWTGDPNNIVVGGAYPGPEKQEAIASAKQPDVVSYMCRPVAKGDSVSGMEQWCGTSFAAPTVAGALSKVILELRETSGYTGGLKNGYVDPLTGVTISDLRNAMNLTASYSPQFRYEGSYPGLPLNPVAPWIQWGWGFYDGLEAEATLAHLLRIETAPEKPEAAILYMESLHEVRSILYG